MPELNGFSAWVSIGGVDATEYNVEVNAETKTVTCWIASQVGQSLSVVWQKTTFQENEDLSGRLKIDGKKCGAKIFFRTKTSPQRRLDGLPEPDGFSVRPFQFSSLTTTDDETAGLQSVSQDLGSIELQIVPIEVTKAAVHRQNDSALPKLVLHEQSKKGITQQVALGAAERHEKFNRISKAKTIGPPFATCRFLYRPLDVLRANGIAPSLKRKASAELDDIGPSRSRRRVSTSATLDSQEEKDHIAVAAEDTTLSDDEDEKALQALQAQMKTLEARRAARKGVKKEVPVKIKKEPSAAGAKKKGKPAVIDLTLD
ncbi:hypothetical protein MKEN_00734500 [Mycena kentingensis (nom. inval.)]|nr:hypothetical protein MKEN_00734500 [Mycena kentingensis (nom. inval.)]